jgi:hypothetical protein
VHGASTRDDTLGSGFQRRRRRDVDLDWEGSTALRHDLLGDSACALLVEIRDGHMDTLLGERERNPMTHTATGPGHECRPSL